VVVSAAAASNGAPTATIAKKCKKKSHSAGEAKKKKCKKSGSGSPATPVAPPQPPHPQVRATLTWDTGADIDLWAFDAAGNLGKASYPEGIANTTWSGDEINGGPETFTDNIFTVPSGRAFSFAVCYYGLGSQLAPFPTNFTIVYVTPDGVSHTATGVLSGIGANSTIPGGPGFAGFAC
jgi:hypothetical protein